MPVTLAPQKPQESREKPSKPQETMSFFSHSPLIKHSVDLVVPCSDAMKKLAQMKIHQKHITVPKILVIGNHSVGKSSFIKFLLDFDFTLSSASVPFIIQLKGSSSLDVKYFLQYNDVSSEIKVDELATKIREATVAICDGKNYSGVPVTLVVEKKCFPELMIVDVPRIDSIMDKDFAPLNDFIINALHDETYIILNLVDASASGDFDATNLVMQYDKDFERSVTVVLGSDECKAENVKVIFGYFYCALKSVNEKKVYDMNKKLLQVDERFIGLESVAKQLATIQLNLLCKSVSETLEKINDELEVCGCKLKGFMVKYDLISDARLPFLSILKSSTAVIYKLFVAEDYHNLKLDIQCRASLDLLLERFYKLFKEVQPVLKNPFLYDEIMLLQDRNWMGSINLFPASIFKTLLESKFNLVADVIDIGLKDIFAYLENVVLTVIEDECKDCPQLGLLFKKVGKRFLVKFFKGIKGHVLNLFQTEKSSVFTCDPGFSFSWADMKGKSMLIEEVLKKNAPYQVCNFPNVGVVDVKHLKMVDEGVWHLALALHERVDSYWSIVAQRFVDYVGLHIMMSVNKLVDGEMETTMMEEFEKEAKNDKKLVKGILVEKKRLELEDKVKELNKLKSYFEAMLD